uniref:Protein translocase subunit SecY n=1 Tax=Trieres chinensis TaxID=1514140 RepID=SECY_TRICV|nr:preprotein translocase subunit SecY [Trieres chinensis]P49461.1 RecName: Full=Protein translocase subunit SecY [Trieres chinensis]CAA91631.1 preprotein-translocase subunit Y [Trieres chinensis]
MKQTDDKDSLLNRLLLSLGILLFIRMGTFLPVPGIDHGHLEFYIERHFRLRTLVSTFAGDNTVVVGLFTLNIFPYINASIIMQLLVSLLPGLSKLQKEGGAEARRSINSLTRLLTLGWSLIQSTSVAFYLKRALFEWNLVLAFEIVIWLTTGAMIVLWLSEIITEYGLGNGPSLLIYTNIVSSLPGFVKQVITESSGKVPIGSWLLSGFVLFVALYGIVLLQEGMRKVYLISSKQLNQTSLPFSGSSNLESGYYIPLRFNQAGVMPIILTTAVLVIPTFIYNLGLLRILTPLITLPVFVKSYKIIYWVSYFVLILLFSLFYSTIVVNPKDLSDELQKMAVSIPGIRPGVETTFYLKQVMKRVTLLGAIMLALLATLPNIIQAILSLSGFTNLGTTSLLILVGVILDLTREMRSIILSNIYYDMFD